MVAPPYALTNCTERPSTLGSSPAPDPEPPEPHPEPEPVAPRFSAPLCPCLPSPPFPLTPGEDFLFPLSCALALARAALAASSAAAASASAAARAAFLSAMRLERFPRPSSSTGAAAASSGDDPLAPCAVSVELCDAFAPSADPAVFAAAASDDVDASAALPDPEPPDPNPAVCFPRSVTWDLRRGLTR